MSLNDYHNREALSLREGNVDSGKGLLHPLNPSATK
jgi:hypothetical protein